MVTYNVGKTFEIKVIFLRLCCVKRLSFQSEKKLLHIKAISSPPIFIQTINNIFAIIIFLKVLLIDLLENELILHNNDLNSVYCPKS